MFLKSFNGNFFHVIIPARLYGDEDINIGHPVFCTVLKKWLYTLLAFLTYNITGNIVIPYWKVNLGTVSF